MILSVSRRTDIPAFFPDWFMGRLREGIVEVPNPFNPKQISRVFLDPEQVEAIIFWTKNPAPLIPRLDELESLGFNHYIFLFTLNHYPRFIEPHIPDLAQRIDTFHQLATRIGPGRMTWRYDPVILADDFTIADHVRQFSALARQLRGATRRVVVAMVHRYRKTKRGFASIPGWEGANGEFSSPADRETLLASFSREAAAAGMEIQACAQQGRLQPYIPDGSCIDGNWQGLLFPGSGNPARHRGQREACLCNKSVDIGVNNTCGHGCIYCYATRDHKQATRVCAEQDIGALTLGT